MNEEINKEVPKGEKAFLYIWDWLMQPFKGILGAMISVMFRGVIVYIIPLIITTNPAPEWKSFPTIYGIMGLVWMIAPLMHTINRHVQEWKWRRLEPLQEEEK